MAASSATEHSSAAEDDNPAPIGRSASIVMSAPPARQPASRSAHATPAAGAAQPLTEPGCSAAIGSTTGSVPACREVIAIWPSRRREAAAYTPAGRANGRTNTSL